MERCEGRFTPCQLGGSCGHFKNACTGSAALVAALGFSGEAGEKGNGQGQALGLRCGKREAVVFHGERFDVVGHAHCVPKPMTGSFSL